MPPSTQVRKITVKVDAAGVKQSLDNIASSLGYINKNTKGLAASLGFLQNAFSGYLGALGIRELARMSDEMQNLNSRLKLVSRAGEDTNEIMGKLAGLANTLKQDVADVATVYTRLGVSLKQANASTAALSSLTEVLVNSFRLSGSTGQEATSTIVQLTQAFSKGKLDGEEFKTVMEQNAVLAGLLKEKFGQDLFKKAKDGAIGVSDILKILRDNMEAINEQAKTLTPTFESGVNKAFNALKTTVFELNKALGASTIFNVIIDQVIEKFTLLAAVAGVLALTQLPALAAAIYGVGGALVVFAMTNPAIAILTALSAAVIITNGSLGGLIDNLRNVAAWFVYLGARALELAVTFNTKLDEAFRKIGLGSKQARVDLMEATTQVKFLDDLATSLGEKKYTPSPIDPNADKDRAKKEFDELIKNIEALSKKKEKVDKIKDVLARLNKEFLEGGMSVDTYNRKIIDFNLYKLNREFAEGKLNLEQFNEGMNKVSNNDLSRQLAIGVINLKQYREGVEQLKIDDLNNKFRAGGMSVQEYNAGLTEVSNKFLPQSALMTGTNSYIESVGTTSMQVADAIKNVFTGLENALTDFITKGKFNFADFTKAILDDLTRIIIRASIIQPLAQGILNFGASSAPTGTMGAEGAYNLNGGGMYSANGNAFDKGHVKYFAKGGVVDGATAFSYGASGKPGIMGESGPEAILPLSRGTGGKLGVQATVTPVTVNIINQAGAEVEQKETTGPNGEKTIEVLITAKVREGLLTGRYDKAMKSAYGLNRKGS